MSDRVSESEWRGEEAEAHYTTVLGLGARCSLDLGAPSFFLAIRVALAMIGYQSNQICTKRRTSAWSTK